MFDIGFWELGLIGLIALIVLGPKRLPEAARTAGRWIGRLRRFIADVKQDLDRELRAEELKELRRLKEELDQTRQLIERSSGEMLQELSEPDPEKNIADPEVRALIMGEDRESATEPKPAARKKSPAKKAAGKKAPARKAKKKTAPGGKKRAAGKKKTAKSAGKSVKKKTSTSPAGKKASRGRSR